MTDHFYRAKVIVEFHGADGWFLMLPDGTVKMFELAREAFDAINAFALKFTKRTGRSSILTLEWRDVPLGFIPPINEVRS